MAIRIKNWARFQHFRNRNCPWIKLYRDLLDDPDWHQLDAKDAKTLIMLWLAASMPDGELPDNKKLAFRLRTTEAELKQAFIKLQHWLIQDDADLISNSHQVDAPDRDRDRDREGDTPPRKPGRKGARPLSALPENWTPSETTLTRLSAEFRFANGDADRYLVAFTDICRSKGYEYRDFDAAFSNCVRQDWPKYRNGARTMPKRADTERPNW